ncbi:putative urea ABC transporter substrate-binding protein [Pseudomonas turukhanskensis]|uniref:Lipid kinase n=1 Tax=Pseudomonas turukhanskensis TaxID=1806536 RepID=A0A9W6NG02_9PSED|nr:putative urea ABC transporter substrate-binding protein [Pseudomonas turukhanskensis]GLK89352.1 lipid kinase [Pseudomonas turukhanskensis]
MPPSRFLVLALALLLASTGAQARDQFRVCWSNAASALPWGYAAQQKIVAKWARKYRISIDVVRVDDPREAAQQYTAGQFDGCTMNNLHALTLPAAAGIDTTALIIGDFSAGNDGVLLRGKGVRAQDLRGKTVQVEENSVAHYLLVRALESVQLDEEDVTVAPVTEPDAGFEATAASNPQLAQLQARGDSSLVYSSHRIPGEIVHLLAVNTATLRENPALGRALTGAWFELTTRMSARDDKGAATLGAIAKNAGLELADYHDQLSKARSFYSPRSAVAFADNPALPAAMERMATFAFKHGMLGKALSAQSIGMSFANGVVVGSPANIKLRFDSAFMQVAADGRL